MARFLSSCVKGRLHFQLAWLLVLVMFAYPNGSIPADLLAPQTTQSDSRSDTDDDTSQEVEVAKISVNRHQSSRRILKTQRMTQRLSDSPECARARATSALRTSPPLASLLGSGIRRQC